MERIVPGIITTILLGSSATLFGQIGPSVTILNDRAYRATSSSSLEYQGGRILFIMFDGAFTDVECGFIPANPLSPPRPVGSLPCPAGDNAFISARFGDGDDDVANFWARLGSVSEAIRIPANLATEIQFDAGPITDLDRPSRLFNDRSTIVLHDLQTAAFSENDITQYNWLTNFSVGDRDINGNGIVTDQERAQFSAIAQSVENDHLGDTIIRSGISNNYLFSYPLRPLVEDSPDLDPGQIPREQIAVSQIQFIEAYPGISRRLGITSARNGFFFDDVDNFGTDLDGDPVLLMDFRDPGSVLWGGNDASTLIPTIDQLFLQVFEERFDANGVPQVAAGPGALQVSAIDVSTSDDEPLALTAFQQVIDPNTLLPVNTHGFDNGEQVLIRQTGLTALEGMRFFVGLQSDRAGFDPMTQFELFLDSGLTQPFVLEALPDGSDAFLNPVEEGLPNIEFDTLISTVRGGITVNDGHGLSNGAEFTIDDSGLTALDGQTFFAFVFNDNTLFFSSTPDPQGLPIIGGNAVDLSNLDVTQTIGTAVGPIVLSIDQNDFEFPIWPFPLVDQSFNGQLVLPSVFDQGYQFPDAAFRLFFGTPFGATDLTAGGAQPRNDLILRLRFDRNVATADTTGNALLMGGDLSLRDFEIELFLVDTLEGSVIAFQQALAGGGLARSAPSAGDLSLSKSSDAESDNPFALESDFDGDGLTNFFEFAFDTNGSVTEQVPAYGDASNEVSPDVKVSISATSGCCELSIGKRPGVRETLEYYFEEVSPDGTVLPVIPGETGDWTLLADDGEVYKVVSKTPVSGSSFFRACVRKNSFGVELAE